MDSIDKTSLYTKIVCQNFCDQRSTYRSARSPGNNFVLFGIKTLFIHSSNQCGARPVNWSSYQDILGTCSQMLPRRLNVFVLAASFHNQIGFNFFPRKTIGVFFLKKSNGLSIDDQAVS